MGWNVLRQIAAAIAAWLVSWAATKGVVLDEATIVAIMLAVFGVVAQGLKVLTTRKAGEIPPGGVAADTTEREKLRVGQL